jgi:hypothetical protein
VVVAYLIGVVLAAAVCGLATIVGFDRDRAFYPVVTIVIVTYYGLFAVMGGSMRALMLESIAIAVFFLLSPASSAISGSSSSRWPRMACLISFMAT